MSSEIGRPLAYPLCMTIGALAVLTAWAPFADPDQLSALIVVGFGIIGYSGYRFCVALGLLRYGPSPSGPVPARRVRQEHQLLSRSWLEIRDGGRARWIPIYFTPELIGFTGGTGFFDSRRILIQDGSTEDPEPTSDTDSEVGNQADTATATRPTADAPGSGIGLRVFPAGRVRDSEPPGRLMDNPSRPDPEARDRAATTAKITRRLLLDAQTAVAAPFAGLLWVYVMDGGTAAFVAAMCVAAATGVWLSAIRGSDPS